jgi:hypothetical protein
VRGIGVDTRRAVLREKYDCTGTVVGLADEIPELGAADDVAGMGFAEFLGPEDRRKDQLKLDRRRFESEA